MVPVVTLGERSIRPIVLSVVKSKLPLCLLPYLLSIRQLGRKCHLPAKTGCLDPWPQFLLVTDTAAVKSRMSSFMYDGRSNQFGG